MLIYIKLDRRTIFSWEPALETLNSQAVAEEAVKKNVNMTKAGNLGVFVCVCVCEVDRHCVCDMLMLVLGTC